MNRTLLEILKAREDISDFAFHFTKGAKAFDTLLKIIKDNAIIDVKPRGHICFTEAPLTSLPKMFRVFDKFPDPYYAPYGIAVKKEHLFEIGARQVIYGKPEEKTELPESWHWRFEKFVPGSNDFTWLREWRYPKSKIELSYDNCFIVTKTKAELGSVMYDLDNFDIDIDGCVDDGEFHGYAIGTSLRRFKGVSLEDLSELEDMSKEELGRHLQQQNLSDVTKFNLGSI